MSKKRKALGKGLGAILSDEYQQVSESNFGNVEKWKGVSDVEVKKIRPNPHQPRKSFDAESLEELAASIRQHGIIQPISVRKMGPEEYQLISGERRLRASKLAGLERIPAYVMNTSEQGMMEMALVENIQREDLNAVEVAVTFRRLMDEFNLSHEQLSDKVGKKRSTISNYLRLLKLPPAIQIGVRDNKIQMGHARAIAGLDKMEDQLDVYREVVNKGLSVRKTESMVKRIQKGETTDSLPTDLYDPNAIHYKEIQSRLQSRFETRVVVSASGGKGSISIPFHNLDDFNRIVDLLED